MVLTVPGIADVLSPLHALSQVSKPPVALSGSGGTFRLAVRGQRSQFAEDPLYPAEFTMSSIATDNPTRGD